MRQVLIIESPGLNDITTGDRTGELLAGQLRLLRISHKLSTIHTSELLEQRLQESAQDSDVIHLSMHGSKEGIHFTDGTYIDWRQLQHKLLAHGGNRLLVISACQSSNFVPDSNLASTMQSLTNGAQSAPRCVFTMFGDVYFVDVVLAWGLFYRRLSSMLNGMPSSQCTPQQVKNSLDAVYKAGFSKICAAFWYEQFGKYQNISPWLSGLGAKKRSTAP
ncbi:C13 family peptidase [Corallococcus exiguus]|uniref:C13 family peptidase n=1 Tax=Corallococcus exiguus TaxID=83462 RepID=UPI001560024F|nr:hypothetical protein [Corallococcus exiguus]